jgi:hypothetical protein
MNSKKGWKNTASTFEKLNKNKYIDTTLYIYTTNES